MTTDRTELNRNETIARYKTRLAMGYFSKGLVTLCDAGDYDTVFDICRILAELQRKLDIQPDEVIHINFSEDE